ncbi:MAG TPA: alpha/beta hydrolase, partial [Steroidobacteraceae bacterium]|nr:alpha/beta hydrolase [Steroidobacteraceae bacterium]
LCLLLALWQTADASPAGAFELTIGASRDDGGLIVFVPGSGCEPVGSQVQSMFHDAPGNWYIMTREKQYTRSLPFALLGCSNEFHHHTTYPQLIKEQIEFARAAIAANPDTCRRVLIGYSEGGTVAPFVAAAVPGFTHVIVLSAGAMRGEDELRTTLAIDNEAGAVDRIIRAIRAAPRDIRNEIQGEKYRYWASMLDLEPMQAYQGIDTPVLMLHGDTDTVVPVAAALFARARAQVLGKRNMTVEVLPRLGHGLGLDSADGRARFWRRVNDWLGTGQCNGTR